MSESIRIADEVDVYGTMENVIDRKQIVVFNKIYGPQALGHSTKAI